MSSNLHTSGRRRRHARLGLLAVLISSAVLANACGGSSPAQPAGAEAPARGEATSTVNSEAAEEAATRREEAELHKREEASIAAARKRRAALAEEQASEGSTTAHRRARAKRKA
jgi:hypothetical protein